mgnify:CR=1 FL=1
MAKGNKNNTATIGFEQQIWAAADILRGNMDAGLYKHVVLGLIFLKFISDKFDARRQELLAADDDAEDKDAYTEVNVFFVPGALFPKRHIKRKSARLLMMQCEQLKKKTNG